MISIAIGDLAEHIGREVGVSDWLRIDQPRVDAFAAATGDFQWIHVDVERATREMGGTIAHGFLILSMISQLSNSLLKLTGVSRGLNYGLNKVRFVSMVRTGERIRLRSRIRSVEAKNGGLLVGYEFVIEIEGQDRPACIAEALGLWFPE